MDIYINYKIILRINFYVLIMCFCVYFVRGLCVIRVFVIYLIKFRLLGYFVSF